jgi:predicted TPR repeat methyltransferase
VTTVLTPALALDIRLPDASISMDQDEEWCDVRVNGGWRRLRLHDYSEIFGIPGLYERLIYDILKCDSPNRVCGMLGDELACRGDSPSDLRVLDLGAGNGMVGEILTGMGATTIVGVDIIDAARRAAERDRPGVYDRYCVTDLARDDSAVPETLRGLDLNCLVCVAALGFGDIPKQVFETALDVIATGGWLALNVKEEFLRDGDESGYGQYLRALHDERAIEIVRRERYVHRRGTDGSPIHYVALVARKLRS